MPLWFTGWFFSYLFRFFVRCFCPFVGGTSTVGQPYCASVRSPFGISFCGCGVCSGWLCRFFWGRFPSYLHECSIVHCFYWFWFAHPLSWGSCVFFPAASLQLLVPSCWSGVSCVLSHPGRGNSAASCLPRAPAL